LSGDEWGELARRGSEDFSNPLADSKGAQFTERMSCASISSVNMPDANSGAGAARELGSLAKDGGEKLAPLPAFKESYVPMRNVPSINRSTKPKPEEQAKQTKPESQRHAQPLPIIPGVC
jgi:hypothetical protein